MYGCAKQTKQEQCHTKAKMTASRNLQLKSQARLIPNNQTYPAAPQNRIKFDNMVTMTTTDITTPVLEITDKAKAKVMGLLDKEESDEALGLRVEIMGVSGADFTYDLTFDAVSAAPSNSAVYEIGELPVIIPPESIDKLQGATLDIPTTPMSQALVIRNPNKPDLLQGKHLDLTGELAEKLQQLLDQHINPSLAAHGGFATLVRVDGTAVYLSMGGGCQGCAMSAATLRDGITAMINQALPEVTQVIDVTDHDAGENPYYS